MIRAACPKCNAALQVEDQHAGKLIACPKCKTSMQLPPGSPPSSPARPNAAPEPAAPPSLPPDSVPPPTPNTAASAALPSASTSSVSVPAQMTQMWGKLVGMVPASIFRPVVGMTSVIVASLFVSLFCGSVVVFFFSFLHNAAAVTCIALATRLQKSLYPLLAALLTITVWGWYWFTDVWTVISIFGLLTGISVGIWALLIFRSPDVKPIFADAIKPGPLDRFHTPTLAGVAGGVLVVILGIGYFAGSPGGGNEKLIQGDWEGQAGGDKIGIKFRKGDAIIQDVGGEVISAKYRFLDKQNIEFTLVSDGKKLKRRLVSLTGDELVIGTEEGGTAEYHRAGGKKGSKTAGGGKTGGKTAGAGKGDGGSSTGAEIVSEDQFVSCAKAIAAQRGTNLQQTVAVLKRWQKDFNMSNSLVAQLGRDIRDAGEWAGLTGDRLLTIVDQVRIELGKQGGTYNAQQTRTQIILRK